MTLYKDGTVDYTGTFFALVRTGLQIYTENGEKVVINAVRKTSCIIFYPFSLFFTFSLYSLANLKSNEQAFRKMLKLEFPNISKRTLDLVIPRAPRGKFKNIYFN